MSQSPRRTSFAPFFRAAAPLLRASALVSAVALIPSATAGLAAVDARSGPQFGKLLAVYQRIKADYVEPIDDDKLVKGAIDGMLASLDPHSSYLDVREFQNLKTQTDLVRFAIRRGILPM